MDQLERDLRAALDDHRLSVALRPDAGNLIRAGLVLCHEKRDFEESVEKAIQNLSFLRSFENVVVEVRYEQPLPGSYVRLQVLHDAPFGFKVNFSLGPARGRRCDHGYKDKRKKRFHHARTFLINNQISGNQTRARRRRPDAAEKSGRNSLRAPSTCGEKEIILSRQ